ncbi:MAG: tRNA (guanine(26)-N(2))-dimethyltransferase [Thermoplasmata archaeon]
MKYTAIREGDTDLIVPPHRPGKGPRGIGKDVFYNPAMELNRDISVAFLRAWGPGKKVLDGMSATGIRGVRIAKETDVREVTMLDLSRDAVELIRRNIEHSGVKAQAVQGSIEGHVLDHRYEYDYIDIDPFGTPVPFFTIPARFVSRGGVLGVTATDTAVLCGTYKKKCIRRYSAVPENNWCRHEIGLRILIGYCVKEAAKYNRGAEPLLSYYDGHHFRTYLEISEGASYADGALECLEKYDFSDHHWAPGDSTGPLWAGDLFDEKLLSQIKLSGDLLETWKGESAFPPFFYDTNVLGSVLKCSPPPLKEMIAALESEGYRAARTHFSPTGFKTDRDVQDILKIFKSA